MNVVCDAFDDLVSLFDLVAQWLMVGVGAAAAYYAYQAFCAQKSQLDELVSENRKREEETRRAKSPLFKVANGLKENLSMVTLADGKEIEAMQVMPSKGGEEYLKEIASLPRTEPVTVWVVLENVRQENDLVDWATNPLSLPEGLRFLGLHKLRHIGFHQSRLGMETNQHWVLGFEILPDLPPHLLEFRVRIRFETIAGHNDSNEYKVWMGPRIHDAPILERMDPPHFALKGK